MDSENSFSGTGIPPNGFGLGRIGYSNNRPAFFKTDVGCKLEIQVFQSLVHPDTFLGMILNQVFVVEVTNCGYPLCRAEQWGFSRQFVQDIKSPEQANQRQKEVDPQQPEHNVFPKGGEFNELNPIQTRKVGELPCVDQTNDLQSIQFQLIHVANQLAGIGPDSAAGSAFPYPDGYKVYGNTARPCWAVGVRRWAVGCGHWVMGDRL